MLFRSIAQINSAIPAQRAGKFLGPIAMCLEFRFSTKTGFVSGSPVTTNAAGWGHKPHTVCIRKSRPSGTTFFDRHAHEIDKTTHPRRSASSQARKTANLACLLLARPFFKVDAASVVFAIGGAAFFVPAVTMAGDQSVTPFPNRQCKWNVHQRGEDPQCRQASG